MDKQYQSKSIRPFLSLLLGLAMLAGTPTALHAGPVPASTVLPLPADTMDVPFGASRHDLGSLGYEETEVFLSGTARSYVPTRPLDAVTDGRWDAAPTGPTAPFKTRLLIRRPANPANFNGTVLVEWLNVSAGRDSGSFDSLGEDFVRAGYAYVGVSAQAAGLNHLRETADKARYASLKHPGDAYSYDIFSQAAAALRSGKPAPLGDLTGGVRELIAWGGSQSGSRLFTYFNAVHPDAGVIDGFIPYITPRGAKLSQAPQPEISVPTGAAAVIRTDIATPVLFENSESEVARSARGLHSQPDSEHFRMWEYAGTSHAQLMSSVAPSPDPGNAGARGMMPRCDNPPGNNLAVSAVWRAMAKAMQVWIREGKAPAIGARVAMIIPTDPGQPAIIERHAFTGLAKGGIRLPDVEAPTRTLHGSPPAAALEKNPICRLFGAVDPWNGDSDPWDGDPAFDLSPTPEPNLKTLYGDSAGYVGAVRRSAEALVAEGFLLKPDADAIVAKAEEISIDQ